MSAIAPDKQEIIKELYSRRDSLAPDKRAIVEELASRSGISSSTHGATGSWDAPSLNERAGAAIEKFQKAHPVLMAPQVALQTLGQTIAEMPGAIYHAATDPLTEQEKARHLGQRGEGGIGVLTDRLLAGQSQRDAYAKAQEDVKAGRTSDSVSHAFEAVPIVGPAVSAVKRGYQEHGLAGAVGVVGGIAAAPALIGSVIEGAGPAAEYLGEKAKAAPRTAADALSDAFKPKDPVVTTMRGLGIKDPEVTKWGPKALDEVGQWSDRNGPVRDTPTLRTALREQMDKNNDLAEPVIQQQRDIVVPGSRAESAQVRIDSIPAEIKADDPVRYQKLVQEARETVKLPDYTIGELDDIRKSLGSKNKTYGKNLSAQIAADHTMAAMDHAQESFARAKLYDSLEQNSGTGLDIQELKARMGAMIKMDNAAFKKVNQSMIESGRRLPERAIELAGKVMTPGTTLKHFGDNATIDSDIASAVRQWKRRPSQIVAPTPKLPAPAPVSSRLALPPAAGQFQIDPSAAPLYGASAADQIRAMMMKPAEEGGGIPMRDVTPPKQKMLPAAPVTARTILRPSGETFTGYPSQRQPAGELAGNAPRPNRILPPSRPAIVPPAPAAANPLNVTNVPWENLRSREPLQIEEPRKLYQAQFVEPPSGKVYRMPPKNIDMLAKYAETQRRIISGKGSAGDSLLARAVPPQVLLHRMAQNLMDDFVEAASEHDGATLKGFSREQSLSSHRGLSLEEQMNMNAEAEAAYTEHLKDYNPTEHSIKSGTIFEQFPEGPKAIIKAIRSGKGKLYGQIIKAVWDEVESYAKQTAPDVFPAERNFKSETEDWFN